MRVFEHTFSNKRFGCYLNVETGSDLTHDDLLAHHHAVIYAVGASRGRDLDIPGNELPGSHSAVDFVGWYNGHPDHAHHEFDLSEERAVIIGNGNVALDVARVLLLDADTLAATDTAPHALTALSDSKIREVVILARRGPRDAAFSAGEFLALGHLPGVDVIIDRGDLTGAPDDETGLKLSIAREYADRPTTPGHKRIVFRFLTSPVEVVGTNRAEGLRISSSDTEMIETPLILRAIGYQGSAIEGLPFNPAESVVPNENGRVIGDGRQPVPGVYVAGWIKRGPRGVIGTNRNCADETVAALLEDFHGGKLAGELAAPAGIGQLLSDRGAAPIGWEGWRAIDAAERRRGAEVSRPRVKFIDVTDMLAAADC